MQIDLEELQPKLKEATIATDALLVQIAKDTEIANEKKAVVEKEVRCEGMQTLLPTTIRCHSQKSLFLCPPFALLAGSNLQCAGRGIKGPESVV